MESLILSAANGVKVTLHSRHFDSEGWLHSYSVLLEAPGLSAAKTVENSPYGTSPPDFFRDIAAHWRGWKGIKSWGSIEGEMNIFSTSDSTGHVTLDFELPAASAPSSWTARALISVEAGQLEQLARDATAFFNEGA